ncbi:hypothetical protein SAMN05421752_105259 [Natronorubrum thiooxidans]|uniref:Uncharacterized protein n=1 Tax=Natronorubrum thiooxidans TaxID=308853 RepID=A0A1N7F1U0_9EURY|nr:hypothetical protein SAMN05421752_105259 [Natronorubrum thiooxidans]
MPYGLCSVLNDRGCDANCLPNVHEAESCDQHADIAPGQRGTGVDEQAEDAEDGSEEIALRSLGDVLT